ncbi:amidophosphoribosyltransferase [Pusillimonas sp. ANT_WB101]|uniref:amidophosphoribosyltransferase n=1 Tax=Pusillimonas sp. ANT_WB101 TaxID=2597356 RepID=UPI0011EC5989|nr:amidophosphoribosyltransferase [Pusillimonas sp. ANT_WB101]KAA0910982.1 amidophosphoribosyltransferase [Pusillimonas sp. ANT_WB101]NYT77299.1 amidophosphoribosyltransferase [Alcaligenaceae bacterium]
MCGIVGVAGAGPVNQLIYDSLLLLQHRGQDAAGISTSHEQFFNMYKAHGLVRDVFRTRNMRSLPGASGLGQVRYPTAGSSESVDEAQPFYVNAPFGIMFVHNGNLTNWRELREELFRIDRRHINTNSDSEVLLNVFAHELQEASHGSTLDDDAIFRAVSAVHRRARGAYAVISQIASYGMVAFRDPHGIRPLCLGSMHTAKGKEWMIASESVALTGCGYTLERDIAPGEAIFIDLDGNLTSRQCAEAPMLTPCAFEYVYFARPDSVMDKVSIYHARLHMGEYLADNVAKALRLGDIDVVMPIPDSSRPSAMQLASRLGLDYREGFIKNRYIGRTFIMPGQAVRKKSVRQKLSAIDMEFRGKNVLLVDDSIVRGTTSREIVDMARAAGANKVFFASAAPPVRFPNVYGIDMPTQAELIAVGRDTGEIAQEIGADGLVYQELGDLEQAIRDLNPHMQAFESSCFNGQYVTGDIDDAYLERLSRTRGERPAAGEMATSGKQD